MAGRTSHLAPKVHRTPSISYSTVSAVDDSFENGRWQDDVDDMDTVSSLSDCSNCEAQADEHTMSERANSSTEKMEVDDHASIIHTVSPVPGWPEKARVLPGISPWLVIEIIVLFLLPIPFLGQFSVTNDLSPDIDQVV